MTNEQLVIKIKAGEDVAGNMQQLYEQTKAFIHTVAMRYQGWQSWKIWSRRAILHYIRQLMDTIRTRV